MQTITVRDRQCFLDLAMQHAGSASAAVAMAFQNLMPLTQLFNAGVELPAPVVVDAEIVQLYKVEKVIPASIHTVITDPPSSGEGIGWWYLENDFIVQ